jgi:hypothetical protein
MLNDRFGRLCTVVDYVKLWVETHADRWLAAASANSTFT